MSQAKLVIRKGMFDIQGKVRACCNIQALVSPEMQAKLEANFLNEALFKRSAYASVWPQNALEIPAAIAPHLAALLKNDACPEITVKTLLAGQLYQGAHSFEMMSFEFIGKVAFENFAALVRCIDEMGSDVIYTSEIGRRSDLAAFHADAVADAKLKPAAGKAAA